MDGLVSGRIVYYVLSAQDAEQINRRRTNAASIAERIEASVWPLGAQAHIGNEAKEGEIVPAQIIRVWGESGCSNLKANLDGSDSYWATSRNYDESKQPGTWHWMFDGQSARYDAQKRG